jgi:hypothetical protein
VKPVDSSRTNTVENKNPGEIALSIQISLKKQEVIPLLHTEDNCHLPELGRRKSLTSFYFLAGSD